MLGYTSWEYRVLGFKEKSPAPGDRPFFDYKTDTIEDAEDMAMFVKSNKYVNSVRISYVEIKEMSEWVKDGDVEFTDKVVSGEIKMFNPGLVGVITQADIYQWPIGCHHPNSCSRHKVCMYVDCKWFGNTKVDFTAGEAK